MQSLGLHPFAIAGFAWNSPGAAAHARIAAAGQVPTALLRVVKLSVHDTGEQAEQEDGSQMIGHTGRTDSTNP